MRLVFATNRDLRAMVAAGQFREDLFYRIHVLSVTLQSLRERKEDIPLLVRAFIDKYNKRLGRAVREATPAALETLAAYHWPGNIRELENVIERTVLFCESDVIDAESLPDEMPLVTIAWEAMSEVPT